MIRVRVVSEAPGLRDDDGRFDRLSEDDEEDGDGEQIFRHLGRLGFGSSMRSIDVPAPPSNLSRLDVSNR